MYFCGCWCPVVGWGRSASPLYSAMQWGGRVVTSTNTQKINKNKALWGWWWGGVVVV